MKTDSFFKAYFLSMTLEKPSVGDKWKVAIKNKTYDLTELNVKKRKICVR